MSLELFLRLRLKRQHPRTNRKWYTLTEKRSDSSMATYMTTTRIGPGPWMFYDVLFQQKEEIYFAGDIFFEEDSSYKEVATDFFRTSAHISSLIPNTFKNFKPRFTIWYFYSIWTGNDNQVSFCFFGGSDLSLICSSLSLSCFSRFQLLLDSLLVVCFPVAKFFIDFLLCVLTQLHLA